MKTGFMRGTIAAKKMSHAVLVEEGCERVFDLDDEIGKACARTFVRDGDTIVVRSPSHLGGTLQEVAAVLTSLSARDVDVQVLSCPNVCPRSIIPAFKTLMQLGLLTASPMLVTDERNHDHDNQNVVISPEAERIAEAIRKASLRSPRVSPAQLTSIVNDVMFGAGNLAQISRRYGVGYGTVRRYAEAARTLADVA